MCLQRLKLKGFLFFLCAMISGSLGAQDLRLWYKEEAARWEENLPLGNGRIGMMPNGGVQQESIVLNEISLWSGGPQDANNYAAAGSVGEIQRLLHAGQNDEAEKLVNKNFVAKGQGSAYGQGAKAPYGSFQNFGFLNFSFPFQGAVEGYVRALDLSAGMATTQFSQDGVTYLREYFTSLAQNVGVIRLSASARQKISFALHFYRDEHIQSHQVVGDDIVVEGRLPNGSGGMGMHFGGRIKIVLKGGRSQVYDHQLMVKDADEVLVYVAAATDFGEKDPLGYTEAQLLVAQKKGFKTLLREHQAAYKGVFNRVSLALVDKASKAELPTDVRLQAFYADPTQDNGLATLYYQYGRYLTISSTDLHSAHPLPPNLQGLWAHQIQTPWNGDYHLNINAQMNHWGVEVSNLSAYHQPFIEMIKRLAIEGQQTAKAYYNAPGWVVYMMTNIWGYSAPGEHASWGASTASGWLCNHLWEHYLFTQDEDYLAEVYPVLKEAARFYHATLVKDVQTGWMVTAPSVSPENAFRMANGKVASVVMGPTIDNQIVRELYEAVLAAQKILADEDPFVDQLAAQLKDLPPAVVVSSSGRVMEWLVDYPEVEPQHRHVSHLYGLYPAAFISPIHTPTWAAAAKKSLERRGDGGTGWSRAWKILFWARLHDGDHALEILRQLLQPAYATDQPAHDRAQAKAQAGTYPNMFCAHPPFQIDGNFGGSAGIAEMLLQSHDGFIHLLPALPTAWSSGHIKGLKARGNITVDIEWKDGKVVHYKLKGKTGTQVKVRVRDQEFMKTL